MHANLNPVRALVLAAALFGGTAPALAQDAAAVRPAETTATYQDWLMRCVTPADQPQICEVVQTLQIEGQGVVASIAVGRATPDSPLLIVIQVPQGVWLPAGITLKVSEAADPLLLDYKRCAQICIAEATLDAVDVDGMKAAMAAGSFTFQDGAQRDVALPVSFNGFSAALDASLQP